MRAWRVVVEKVSVNIRILPNVILSAWNQRRGNRNIENLTTMMLDQYYYLYQKAAPYHGQKKELSSRVLKYHHKYGYYLGRSVKNTGENPL